MTKKRNFSDQFKATVALEALHGDKELREIAAKRQLHPTQVSSAIPLTRPLLELHATVRLRDFIPPEATPISVARVIGVLLTLPALYCYDWFCGSFLGTQFSTVRNPRIEFISRKCLYLNGFLFMSTPLLGTN